ncbi:hypothetical protein NHX12_031733 [Muraenolepis orangiensis]|uniref:Uncharacterized protein n=1 Tax=Muraenolepis orangiensis TaxID=630683 RepID=A0A9Q0E6F9_9TELE|nr:hypothetical protein NHX12_031733 [Muraenolepis orangiensis]
MNGMWEHPAESAAHQSGDVTDSDSRGNGRTPPRGKPWSKPFALTHRGTRRPTTSSSSSSSFEETYQNLLLID